MTQYNWRDDTPKCVECGCAGNEECGHPPPQWAIDDGTCCALDSAGFCACCKDKANKERKQ